MKMLITISPQTKETEKKYLKHENRLLTIKPFYSNIEGLTLCLQNANGIPKRLAIPVTEEIFISEDIIDYGYFWFEYLSADREYKITVDLN